MQTQNSGQMISAFMEQSEVLKLLSQMFQNVCNLTLQTYFVKSLEQPIPLRTPFLDSLIKYVISRLRGQNLFCYVMEGYLQGRHGSRHKRERADKSLGWADSLHDPFLFCFLNIYLFINPFCIQTKVLPPLLASPQPTPIQSSEKVRDPIGSQHSLAHEFAAGSHFFQGVSTF